MSEFSIKDAHRTIVGPKFDLREVSPDSTPGFKGKGKDLDAAFEEPDEELLRLQKMLWANWRAGTPGTGSLLVVLQGMDTSGKGGVVRQVFGLFPPFGLKVTAFSKPTEEELAHDFLWRIRPHVPETGEIAVWDRSHYEDVLVHRVYQLSSPDEIDRRYGAITDFEWELAQRGTRIIKVMLHISPEFQAENLLARLEDPEKFWKYNPGDIDDRQNWDAYQEAFQIAMTRTSTAYAPWFCVPGDNKDYARMVVKYLVLDAMRSMNLSWPENHFDPEVEKQRLAAVQI
ncbi:PPK2 family polyphosphate kinase [Corynebacterium sp. A21]|uniref:PPK2 family polyphosphate kinase n=1 Tax=Corynebacterium sp. A21 TaxID=3457318 RepID=UPI003FCF6571